MKKGISPTGYPFLFKWKPSSFWLYVPSAVQEVVKDGGCDDQNAQDDIKCAVTCYRNDESQNIGPNPSPASSMIKKVDVAIPIR